MLHLHVGNCDKVFARALQVGATLEVAAQDQFYGDRSGNFRDPFGHCRNVGHSIGNVSPEQMQRRYMALIEPPG